MRTPLLLTATLLAFIWQSFSYADEGQIPRYKPSSRSPEALDIRTNSYGASRSAPDAIGVGEQVVDFSAAKAGGGLVSLRQKRQQGDVAIIFYRGHW
jgi:hypothetical protein